MQLRLAYLEFMSPNLPEAGAALCAAGCTHVDVLPLFLGTGGHVRQDLPPLLQRLRDAHPSVHWRLHAAIGEQPRVHRGDGRDRAVAAGRLRCDDRRRRMNLHQFRFVQEAVRRNLNLTETAKALFTSQPGISKAILELEEELGIDIFARHGKRLRRVTEPGQEVLKSIEIIMREVANLKRIGEEFSKQDAGTLSIATTHTQARYFLPEPVAQLRRRYPKVQVVLHQGTPEQVARMLLDEAADIGLATESLTDFDDLVTLPCYEWQHAVVVPRTHPLASVRAADAGAAGVRAAGDLPPDVHRPHAHRRRLRRRG